MTEKRTDSQSDPVKKPAPRREVHGAGSDPRRHKMGTATEIKPAPQRREKEKS